MTEKNSPSRLSAPAVLARLGNQHGYRFDGAAVELTASFVVAHSAAHQRAWALQLWACAAAPTSRTAVDGVCVAEAALPPLAELGDAEEGFSLRASATPPAGHGSHVMVLALAARSREGFDEVHDLAVYPSAERFCQPRFHGESGYRFDGDRVVLTASVDNPRDPLNLSGTLSLELWALPAPYTGGSFSGHSLAGAILGRLHGQTGWSNLQLNLPATTPAAGTWHYTLMIREWNGHAYLTRDFVSFAQPVVVPAAEPEAAKPAAPAPAAVKAPAPSVPARAGARKPVAPQDRRVPINSATEAELREIKGLSRPVARAIIAARPFASLDALLEIKGLGPKLLSKFRPFLRLD